jgi:hypothetical protein
VGVCASSAAPHRSPVLRNAAYSAMACPPTFQPFSADDENPNSFNPGINALENEGAYAIIPDVERLTAEGHTILNFGPGQPDFPTPQHVKDAGCDAIQGNQTTYTNPSGTGDIKAEIAKFMNRTRGLEGEQAVVVRCPAPRGVSLRMLQADLPRRWLLLRGRMPKL